MPFFHASPRFITSFSGIWERLISIASPVDCGMGRAIAPAALTWALDPPVAKSPIWLQLINLPVGEHRLCIDRLMESVLA